METVGIVCKYCGSPNLAKYGYYRGMPRWWCKDCKRKFAHGGTLPGMRVPGEPVAYALHMFYEGMSLNAIRRRLKDDYGIHPSPSTVHAWITKFSGRAISLANKYRPAVGGTWLVTSKKLRVTGVDTQVWEVIDVGSGFLLVSYQSRPDDPQAPALVLESAASRAGKSPKVIIADKPADYKEAPVAARASVIATPEFLRTEAQARVILGFRSASVVRDRIIQSAKKADTARLFAEGWLVHYNFLSGNVVLAKQRSGRGTREKSRPKSWADILQFQGLPL